MKADFEVAFTTIRLVLGLAKDEYVIRLKSCLDGTGGIGVNRFRREPDAYLDAIESLGILTSLTDLVNRPFDWRDILTERLRFGRGSAIKGQKRGRALEDATEEIIVRVFGPGNYDTRCRFVGATGEGTEKADFAIPSKEDPRILIECKGYGSTGSKQTDVLGDIERVVSKKRSDTHLLLVADGLSWKERMNDLRRLVGWQNTGKITRIYTQSMAKDLERDLEQLKRDHSL